MIDLHTHTIWSDGELVPFELVRRAAAAGYRAIALTDHVDASNIGTVVPAVARAVQMLRPHVSLDVLCGAEITHAPPALIPELVREARELGAEIVVVHGETIAEPVEPGTNRAAIEAGADILSHPGLISAEDAILAEERGVALEITSRKGHSLTNGHVAREALKFGAPLVINTDSHGPSDLITTEAAVRILLGAGVEEGRIDSVFETSAAIVRKLLRRTNA
ncbi:MAG: histidinol phosphate phosphatase domain-containing protein [Thermodesulfovibrionales bacterium]